MSGEVRMIQRSAVASSITGTTDTAIQFDGDDWAGDSSYWVDVRGYSHLLASCIAIGGTSADITINGAVYAAESTAPVAGAIATLYAKTDVTAVGTLLGTFAAAGGKCEGVRIEGLAFIQVKVEPDATDEITTVAINLY